MLNQTNITPPRVPFTDERTGLISREWYRFFLNLFTLTGGGANATTLLDLQVGPSIEAALANYDAAISNLASSVETQPEPNLGTLASVNEDNIRFFQFNPNPSPMPDTTQPGVMYFGSNGGLNIVMGTSSPSDVIQQVGEELYVYGRASNDITNGQVVYRSGAYGASGVITFEPAPIGLTDADAIVGIATENIAKNSFGRVTNFGSVHGLNTTGFADGDAIYYDPTVVGGYTKVKPSAPNLKVYLGVVTKSAGGTNGTIFVNVNNGSVLGGTDSNVQISSPTTGQALVYGSSGYWINAGVSGAIATVASSLADGSIGAIPYQIAVSSTTFLPIGTTSYILNVNNSGFPAWTSTPALGTPTGGLLTNCTGLPISTGVTGLGTGIATFLGSPSSANLASALTDETGTGVAVFSSGPTLTGTTRTSAITLQGGDLVLSGGQIYLDNAKYLYTYTSAGSGMRLLALNSANVGYVGPVDAGAVSTQYSISSTNAASTFYTSGAATLVLSNRNFYGIAGVTSMTNGFVFIPSGAGAPTGVPSSIPSSRVPMYYNATSNVFYVYNGGWKSVALA